MGKLLLEWKFNFYLKNGREIVRKKRGRIKTLCLAKRWCRFSLMISNDCKNYRNYTRIWWRRSNFNITFTICYLTLLKETKKQNNFRRSTIILFGDEITDLPGRSLFLKELLVVSYRQALYTKQSKSVAWQQRSIGNRWSEPGAMVCADRHVQRPVTTTDEQTVVWWDLVVSMVTYEKVSKSLSTFWLSTAGLKPLYFL